jgi:hypothetical protein
MASTSTDLAIIRQLTPNVTIISIPFLRFGLLKVGMRTTIVKLPSGALAVFSPIAFTPSIKATLEKLGNNVEYLIAPDMEHHMFLGAWAAAYPKARLLGPEGMEVKEKDLTFSTIFTKNGLSVSPEFDAEFEYIFAAQHPTKELVFLAKKDKAIILADFIFNLPSYEQFSQSAKGQEADKGIFTKIFAGIMNTKGEATWQKRFLWYTMSAARENLNESAKIIDGWEFDKIIVAHGDVIEGNGKEVFETVYGWHLNGKGTSKTK